MNSRRNVWLLLTLILTVAANRADAQTKTEAAADAKDDQSKLIDERIAFVKAFYGVDVNHLAELRELLKQRVDAQNKYMKENELTLRRRTTAISTAIPQEKDIDATQAAELREKYQDEIYRIHEGAPMSLTQTVMLAEDTLDPQGRKAGRAKIERFFAKQLHGKPLDLARLDRLVLAPVESLNVSPTESLSSVNQKQMGKKPVQKQRPAYVESPERAKLDRDARLEAAKQAALRSKQNAAKVTPESNLPPPPPTADRRTGKEFLKAPAMDQWETEYQTWATEYEFTPEQRQTAESIYSQCIKRAHEVAGESNGKSEGNPLDKVFTQMKQRIDSVASVEQRERLEAKAKGKSAETAKGDDTTDKKS